MDNPILDIQVISNNGPIIPISDVTSNMGKLPTNSSQFRPNAKLISVHAPTTPIYNFRKKTVMTVLGSISRFDCILVCIILIEQPNSILSLIDGLGLFAMNTWILLEILYYCSWLCFWLYYFGIIDLHKYGVHF